MSAAAASRTARRSWAEDKRCSRCGRERAHGKSRCQKHLDEHRAWTQRKRDEARARRLAEPAAPTPCPHVVYRQARERVLGQFARLDHSRTQWDLRRVSVEYEKRLRAAGLLTTKVNEPPPGWSIEEDIREEMISLSEHLAMRKVG